MLYNYALALKIDVVTQIIILHKSYTQQTAFHSLRKTDMFCANC